MEDTTKTAIRAELERTIAEYRKGDETLKASDACLMAISNVISIVYEIGCEIDGKEPHHRDFDALSETLWNSRTFQAED